MYAFPSGFFLICHKSMKKEIFIMRKEQITVTQISDSTVYKKGKAAEMKKC